MKGSLSTFNLFIIFMKTLFRYFHPVFRFLILRNYFRQPFRLPVLRNYFRPVFQLPISFDYFRPVFQLPISFDYFRPVFLSITTLFRQTIYTDPHLIYYDYRKNNKTRRTQPSLKMLS